MSTRPALVGFETRLLAELRQVVAERAAAAPPPVAAAPHPAAETRPAAPGPSALNPAARRQAGRGWPHRRLAITGALSVAGAAGLAVALTVTLTGNGGRPAGPARFAAATTAVAVLNNAALAVQSEPAVTPRPDQFVYLKLLGITEDTPSPSHGAADRGDPPSPSRIVRSTESWISVSGTHKGLSATIARIGSQPAKKYRTFGLWCQDGFVDGHAQGDGRPGRHCTPHEFAAYKPWLPSTPAGMLGYIASTDPRNQPPRTGPRNPDTDEDAGILLVLAFNLLSTTDLTPAQQAAVFHALAAVPHLHIVPKANDALGRTGVGIRVAAQAGTFTLIFDPGTFRLLGIDLINGTVAHRVALAGPATVVDRVGQRP